MNQGIFLIPYLHWPLRSVVTGCLLISLLAVQPLAAREIRILVDTDSRTLSVMEGEKVVEVYEDIAIGRYGKTYYKMKGDNKTPLGRFTIRRIPQETRYYRFFGLDYPDLESASRALEEARIDEDQWRAIRRALRAGKTPPQLTPLGGYIGIHGLGEGDPAIHEQYNWTNGCIALTNEQIDRLSRWIKIGMPVEIR